MTTRNDEQLEKEAKEDFIKKISMLFLLVILLLIVAGLVSIPWWITGISKGVKLLSSILIFGILYIGMGKGK